MCIKTDLEERLAAGSTFIEMPSKAENPNFLETDRTFTFEMFDQPKAKLNVQSLKDIISEKIQVQDPVHGL